MSKAYRVNYGLIDFSKEIVVEPKERPAPKRSALAFPMVISDSMPEAEHVDGKVYTSKSAYRAVTRREGYIEVGTEKLKPSAPIRPDKAEIANALRRAKARLS